MKIIKKINITVFDLKISENKIVFFLQKIKNGKNTRVAFLTNHELDFLDKYEFEIGFLGNTIIKHCLYVLSNNNQISCINIENEEIERRYQLIDSDILPIYFLNESQLLYKTGFNFKIFDFVLNKEIGITKGENFGLDFKYHKNQYFIYQSLDIRTKIICLEIVPFLQKWELDFKKIDELFFKKEDNKSKIKSIVDLEILQFEIFENKVVVRLRSHVLLCIEIESGKILWVNHDENYANFHQMLEFQISEKGEIYVLGDALNRKLRKIDINTGELVWQSENDWMKQAEITHSYISEFTMNEKYVFVASVSFGQILVIEKETGLVVEKVNFYNKPKMIYGVVTKPTLFQNKLFIIVVGELFVFDISEYV